MCSLLERFMERIQRTATFMEQHSEDTKLKTKEVNAYEKCK